MASSCVALEIKRQPYEGYIAAGDVDEVHSEPERCRDWLLVSGC